MLTVHDSGVALVLDVSAAQASHMGPLRLLVADDHEIVRKGLCVLLQDQPGWVVAAEASNGREAVEKTKETKPDIVIMDIGCQN